MIYSAIETTCFGLYWPSSGFYNIKEGPIKAVKNSRGGGGWLRDLYIIPLTTLFNSKIKADKNFPYLCIVQYD